MIFKKWICNVFSSLRNRMLLFLVLIPTVTITIFVATIYSNMTDIINRRIYDSFQVQVDSTGHSIEDAFYEMHIISSNIVYLGSPTVEMLDDLINGPNTVSRENARRRIESTLILYEFNSKSIGLIAIEDLTERKLLVTNGGNRSNSLYDIPKTIYSINDTLLHSPHLAYNNLDRGYVLSAYREFDVSFIDHHMAIYMETKIDFLSDIFKEAIERNSSDSGLILCLADPDGTILYSSNSELLPIGDNYDSLTEERPAFKTGYHLFTYEQEDWTIAGFVNNYYYNQVYWPLLVQFGLSLLVLLTLNVTLSVLLWRSVINPIRNFSNELKKNNTAVLYDSYKTLEFDEYRKEFNKLRIQIQQLVAQAETNARRQATLETELLLSRINPHFLHNMLDNIKLLAKKNGANEVAGLLAAINNLTHYNLGKHKITTIREEIQAVDDYLILQGRIFDFEYEKNIVIGPVTLQMKLPCFILQPIVENSLLHGYTPNLVINLSITEDEGSVFIAVKDNGLGMDVEALEQLQGLVNEKSGGLGIGMSYVYRSLKLMYGNFIQLKFESKLKHGTITTIEISKGAGNGGNPFA